MRCHSALGNGTIEVSITIVMTCYTALKLAFMSTGPGYNKLPQIPRTHLRIGAVPRSRDLRIVSIVMVDLICLRCWILNCWILFLVLQFLFLFLFLLFDSYVIYLTWWFGSDVGPRWSFFSAYPWRTATPTNKIISDKTLFSLNTWLCAYLPYFWSWNFKLPQGLCSPVLAFLQVLQIYTIMSLMLIT